MPVSFPLDKIPALPSQAVALLVDQINVFINKIQSEIEATISEAAKLPDDVGCDYPPIQDLLARIKNIQKMVEKVMELIPLIEKIIKLLKTLLAIANAIKASIFLIPIVGQAALMAELAIVQNMVLANATVAVKQLGTIPGSMAASLEATLRNLASVAIKLDTKCGDDDLNGDGGNLVTNENLQKAIDDYDFSDSIPEKQPAGEWLLVQGSGTLGSPSGQPPVPKSPYTDSNGDIWIWNGEIDPGTGVAWGSKRSRLDDNTMGSEFYSELNVGINDITARIESIELLVNSQRDLLTSLQEAPAQSYNGSGPPDAELGKSGDYYIDTTGNGIYGPKDNNGWPDVVNY